jgi:hypothetical protein
MKAIGRVICPMGKENKFGESQTKDKLHMKDSFSMVKNMGEANTNHSNGNTMDLSPPMK